MRRRKTEWMWAAWMAAAVLLAIFVSEESKHRNTNTLPGSVDRIWNFDGGIAY